MGLFRVFGSLGLVASFAACATVPPVETAPSSEPAARAVTTSRVVAPRSLKSRQLEIYYARLQNDLKARGLMRVDGGGPGEQFDEEDLVRDFVKIALFDEYSSQGGGLVARETASSLRRWDKPIRMSVEFGNTIPKDQRQTDTRNVISYAKRLGRVTGHPISAGVSPSSANYHVLILNEDDRSNVSERLRELVPGIGFGAIRAVETMSRSTLCLVFAFSETDNANAYSKAVAVIRGEHPDLLRQSCVHEELAQGLGLANDSATARPSIFNDDEEFGLLTYHDELLLKMLYDRRFRTGMTAEQARPIARQIAQELL